MTIANGYCTEAEFKLYADTSSTGASATAVIEDIIEGVSRFIDGETGRKFYSSTGTRYYSVPDDLDNPRLLMLDADLLSITTLTNGDDATIAATEYNFLPKNWTPYYAIKLKEGSSYVWTYDSDGNTEYVISVAGAWGFSATAPHDIRQACLSIAHKAWKRFGENATTDTIITAGGVVITPRDVPATAARTLRYYRRWL